MATTYNKECDLDQNMPLKQTPLYQDCLRQNARFAAFADWEMPMQFSSLIEEHQAVRKAAGIFDISHMGIFQIEGGNAKDVLQTLVPTDLNRIGPGEACYTLLLNKEGGIIDDLIIYDLGSNEKGNEILLIVINAACTEKDIAWFKANFHKKKLDIYDIKNDNIFIALQGPDSQEIIEEYFNHSLKSLPRFGHCQIKLTEQAFVKPTSIFVSRTGYTGEDGFELILNAETGKHFWRTLINQGILPCGLGARDTLRQEAAMHLYGHEIKQTTTPFEAGLGWLVHLEMESNFVGREALEKQNQEGIEKKLIGLMLESRGIAREGYAVLHDGKAIGSITSGTWSPTLGKAIAMAYVPIEFAKTGQSLDIEIRGKAFKATVVKRPFYRRG